MNILIVTASQTGNTLKVADTIARIADTGKHSVTILEASGECDVHLPDYDLVFAGTGVYDRKPTKKDERDDLMHSWPGGVRDKLVVPAAPRRPGQYAVIFCTYGGVHTGVNEAVPAVKQVGQLFDHYGMDILDEWYVVGEFVAERHAALQQQRQIGEHLRTPQSGGSGGHRPAYASHSSRRFEPDCSLTAFRFYPDRPVLQDNTGRVRKSGRTSLFPANSGQAAS